MPTSRINPRVGVLKRHAYSSPLKHMQFQQPEIPHGVIILRIVKLQIIPPAVYNQKIQLLEKVHGAAVPLRRGALDLRLYPLNRFLAYL